jgi:uncharacterized membrane protein
VLLIGVATLTVVLSWTVVNTMYTLRYTDLHFASTAGGVAFDVPAGVAAARVLRFRVRRLHDRHDLSGV